MKTPDETLLHALLATMPRTSLRVLVDFGAAYRPMTAAESTAALHEAVTRQALFYGDSPIATEEPKP